MITNPKIGLGIPAPPLIDDFTPVFEPFKPKPNLKLTEDDYQESNRDRFLIPPLGEVLFEDEPL